MISLGLRRDMETHLCCADAWMPHCFSQPCYISSDKGEGKPSVLKMLKFKEEDSFDFNWAKRKWNTQILCGARSFESSLVLMRKVLGKGQKSQVSWISLVRGGMLGTQHGLWNCGPPANANYQCWTHLNWSIFLKFPFGSVESSPFPVASSM